MTRALATAMWTQRSSNRPLVFQASVASRLAAVPRFGATADQIAAEAGFSVRATQKLAKARRVLAALRETGYNGALTAEYWPYTHGLEVTLGHVASSLKAIMAL